MTAPPEQQLLFPTIEDLELETVPRYRLDLVHEESTRYDRRIGLSCPEDVQAWVAEQIAARPQEHVVVLFLDARRYLIGWTIPFIGSFNRSIVEPRPILQVGLLLNAASFILAHNHPSGDPAPSSEDHAVTKRLSEAGDVVGLRLDDHLVIGHAGRWVSLRRQGALRRFG